MNLDKPILSLSGKNVDAFTMRDCFTGFQIFGGTGSGKTSGSGKYIAHRFLKNGFGGLVLTVKPDECGEWQEWAKVTGRSDDLIIFKPSNPYRFDFLNYEQGRGGDGGGNSYNIVNLLTTACDIARPAESAGGGGDQFWEDAGNELIAKTVDLISLAGDQITVRNILTVINSAPTHNKTVKRDSDGKEVNIIFNPKERDTQGKKVYGKFAQLIIAASNRIKSGKLDKQQKRDFDCCYEYFLQDYATLADRTRSSIKMHVTTTLYQLLRGEMGRLFCNGKAEGEEIEIKLEESYLTGKIFIVDMPVMEWQAIGKLAQGLFKHMFQRVIERRSLKQHPNPVFIWADEAQYFLNRGDMMFLTTARSSGCATVYLTQNIENYYSIMAEPVTRSMLGNLQTKIFHQNTDVKTNEYAVSLIGKIWSEVGSRSINYSAAPEASGSLGNTQSEQLINKIEPEQFNELRTGGIHNDLIVDGVVFSGGRKWGRTEDFFDVVEFKQGD